jgi:hypothetical protein
MNKSNTAGKFKVPLTGSEKKYKKDQEEYTPEMKDRKQLHDESEGGEFLDDAVEFEKPPSADNEENIQG